MFDLKKQRLTRFGHHHATLKHSNETQTCEIYPVFAPPECKVTISAFLAVWIIIKYKGLIVILFVVYFHLKLRDLNCEQFSWRLV